MNKDKKNLLIIQQDLDQITKYLECHPSFRNKTENAYFLKKIEEAEIVSDIEQEWDLVRLNSKVQIKELRKALTYSYTVVMPEHSDHKRCRVSVFSLIGNALFGKRKGEEVIWYTAEGNRRFVVMNVSVLNKEPGN